MEINKIYNENCLDTMSKMPDEFLDLVVTSPPYDSLRSYNGYSFDFESIAKELYRVMKQGGVIVWVVGDASVDGSETGTSFRQALFFKDLGFNIHDTMIFTKYGFPRTQKRYEQRFEYMFVFSKGAPKTFNGIRVPAKYPGHTIRGATRGVNGEMEIKHGFLKGKKGDATVLKGNVWNYGVGLGGSYTDRWVADHPAVFPEKLAHDHIISWSSISDLVFDPFMGSGTVAKMCILNKRNFIGSEISEQYYQIAERRISDAKYNSGSDFVE